MRYADCFIVAAMMRGVPLMVLCVLTLALSACSAKRAHGPAAALGRIEKRNGAEAIPRAGPPRARVERNGTADARQRPPRVTSPGVTPDARQGASRSGASNTAQAIAQHPSTATAPLHDEATASATSTKATLSGPNSNPAGSSNHADAAGGSSSSIRIIETAAPLARDRTAVAAFGLGMAALLAVAWLIGRRYSRHTPSA